MRFAKPLYNNGWINFDINWRIRQAQALIEREEDEADERSISEYRGLIKRLVIAFEEIIDINLKQTRPNAMTDACAEAAAGFEVPGGFFFDRNCDCEIDGYWAWVKDGGNIDMIECDKGSYDDYPERYYDNSSMTPIHVAHAESRKTIIGVVDREKIQWLGTDAQKLHFCMLARGWADGLA